MTSKEQKKFKKRKQREKDVRKKILTRREIIRAPEREERAFQKKLKRIDKLKKEMGDLNVWSDDIFLKMTDDTLSQLEKNAKILKALEDEFREETTKKRNLNEQLEAEGFQTLDEKLSHLHNKLVNQQKALYDQTGMSEERSEAFTSASEKLKKPGKEVSEVEVIKAKPPESENPQET